jgi:hypothetical protein
LLAGCSDGFEPEPAPFTGPTGPREPLPAWTPPACERDLATAPPPEADELAQLTWAMTAHWRGKVMTTFETGAGGEAFLVDVTFEPTGHYKAHSLMPGYKAFYYGEDDDVPEKTWTLFGLDGIDDDRHGVGELEVWFGPGNTQTGQFQRVMASEDLSALRFHFIPIFSGFVAPLLYELRCEP